MQCVDDVEATGEEVLHDLANRLEQPLSGYALPAPGNTSEQIMAVFIRSGFAGNSGADKFFLLRTRAFHYAWGKPSRTMPGPVRYTLPYRFLPIVKIPMSVPPLESRSLESLRHSKAV